ncbi:MAG: hypothetical protein MUF33_02215 [Candidatus Nanopelagicales bacterium]|jgi:hypothetical protein|nr:hypothetical protein [Candidatus Nanopelagicales bacterium]
MSEWQPTEAMVSHAAVILEDWFGHDEPTLRTDARDMLMEFGPWIAARALREAADGWLRQKEDDWLEAVDPELWLRARADAEEGKP